MKTFTLLFFSFIFSLSLSAQIEALSIEQQTKKFQMVVPIPGLSIHFPVGLIYQDTSGNAFTNLSDELLRIADGPIGFQFQTNPIIFSEVTKNNFSINHFTPTGGTFSIAPSRRGNWGPRDVSSPYYYDFNTFGDIYNVDFANRRLSELSSSSGRGALKLHRYSGGFSYTHTLTINSSGTPIWSAISDRSVKENIRDVQALLPRVLKLQMKDYNYKGIEEATRGFIAQEVQEIFPEMVTKTDSGLLAVDYLGFGTLAIQAIKEQQATIDALEVRLAKIEKLLGEK